MEEKRLSTSAMWCALLLVSWEMALPALACSDDGGDCRTCIANRMKFDCPKCVPIMRCLGKCLWSGKSQSKCIKKCDCNGGYPRLSDCKKCLLQCKCSCSAV